MLKARLAGSVSPLSDAHPRRVRFPNQRIVTLFPVQLQAGAMLLP